MARREKRRNRSGFDMPFALSNADTGQSYDRRLNDSASAREHRKMYAEAMREFAETGRTAKLEALGVIETEDAE